MGTKEEVEYKIELAEQYFFVKGGGGGGGGAAQCLGARNYIHIVVREP